jgi:GNAT superfamily N-acetyltransferase
MHIREYKPDQFFRASIDTMDDFEDFKTYVAEYFCSKTPRRGEAVFNDLNEADEFLFRVDFIVDGHLKPGNGVQPRTLVYCAEVDLRSHADGCNPALPVGYLEGWYVVEEARQSGIGRRLLSVAEDWARSHGCVEMASDSIPVRRAWSML